MPLCTFLHYLLKELLQIANQKTLQKIVSYFLPQKTCLTSSYPEVEWSSCGRQSGDQCVWVSGLPLGPLTRFYLVLSSSGNYFSLLSKALSLTRKRVCTLQCNHSLVRLLKPNNYTLPSHLRLCSLSVASYDSQELRWKYSNPPPHGVSLTTRRTAQTYHSMDCIKVMLVW
jgi:hypothetical protein